MKTPIRTVLFDLDGTLIDSAPDLAGTGNDMRAARGLPLLPYAALRPLVGTGARGMVAASLGVGADSPEFPALRDEFLARYEQRMTQLTHVFPLVLGLLQQLSAHAVPWGIMTNKNSRFAAPLVQALGLRAATLVCGDTTPHAKPHPEPLLEAARRMGVEPAQCVYVGDDLRDVQAGRAAGMRTVAAAWGYLGDGEPIGQWGADFIIESPDQLLNALGMA